MNTPTGSGATLVRVFLSYGRLDALRIAQELAEFLRSKGLEPWLDVENGIPIGVPFNTGYEERVRPLLSCLVAARGPLPEPLLRAASG